MPNVAYLRSRLARRRRFCTAVALLWLGAISAGSVAALHGRPQSADVRASAWMWLVAFSIPAVVLAVARIRTTAILLVTAAVSAAASIAGAWGTLRDAHSTAAIGVFTVPMSAAFMGLAGWLIDVCWRSR
jgi:hypothetical protein